MKKTILESRLFISQGSLSRKRTVKDYEIDIECADGREYTYNGITYKLKRGDVLVRTPGGTVSSRGFQRSYLLTLDFTDRKADSTYSRNIPGELQDIFDNELITSLEPVIHPRNSYALFEIYENLSLTLHLESDFALALVDEIIFTLNADIAHEKYLKKNKTDSTIDKIINYMEENIEKRIRLDDLARISNLEKSYLIRYFKSKTGTTPFNTLSIMRLNRASDLLLTTEMKISEIALAVGYNTTSFFISDYKKRFGITPSVHRKNISHKD